MATLREDVRKAAPLGDVRKAASKRQSRWEVLIGSCVPIRNLNQPAREAYVASRAGGNLTCKILGQRNEWEEWEFGRENNETATPLHGAGDAEKTIEMIN
ncbi:hypothetical protein BDZ89DRAFT_1087429 [Hymenopellis radicata]|nr:hypothetical protein BDZ89DRAFT_1087429 [Hymenopellis radicata]